MATTNDRVRAAFDVASRDDAQYQEDMAAVMSSVGVLFDEGEDDLQQGPPKKGKWGGSIPGKSPNKKRDFEAAAANVKKWYFSGIDSTYDEKHFERRFRMSRAVFNRIRDRICGQPPFVDYVDVATRKKCIDPLVRLVCAMRTISEGTSFDSKDECFQMSETATINAVESYCKLMIQEFGDEYLNRSPTPVEKEKVLKRMAERGFPGAFASWDCKHFVWEGCPMRAHGQHKGHHAGGKKTLILEAISDPNTYIWYTHFGEPGSLNDLNQLNKSNIVAGILSGKLETKVQPYQIGQSMIMRDHMYFLVDGIYPNWSIFAKTVHHPLTTVEKMYSNQQEAVRKDVERAFGILVKKFSILKQPLRKWYLNDVQDLMKCCIIMHNMVVEDRVDLEEDDGEVLPVALFGVPAAPYNPIVTTALGQRIAEMRVTTENEQLHFAMKLDLIQLVSDRAEAHANDETM